MRELQPDVSRGRTSVLCDHAEPLFSSPLQIFEQKKGASAGASRLSSFYFVDQEPALVLRFTDTGGNRQTFVIDG